MEIQKTNIRHNNKFALAGLILGICSFLFGGVERSILGSMVIMLPILTIVFSLLGFVNLKKEDIITKSEISIVGLIIGVIYTIIYLV